MGFGRGKGFTSKVRAWMTKFTVSVAFTSYAMPVLDKLTSSKAVTASKVSQDKSTSGKLTLSKSLEIILEEQTEEQTANNGQQSLYTDIGRRISQRLTIPNRTVTKLAFLIKKIGAPTGDITYEIRKVSDDSLIVSKVLGDASALQTTPTWEEVTFDTPQLVNEEVRICIYYIGGDASNNVSCRAQWSDVKADEYLSYMPNTTWTDYTSYDFTYRYKYY